MDHRVYVLVDSSGLVKVGTTSDLSRRASQYATHNPSLEVYFTQELPDSFDAREVERMAHMILAEFNQGHEWFRCSARSARFAVERATDLVQGICSAQKLVSDRESEKLCADVWGQLFMRVADDVSIT